MGIFSDHSVFSTKKRECIVQFGASRCITAYNEPKEVDVYRKLTNKQAISRIYLADLRATMFICYIVCIIRRFDVWRKRHSVLQFECKRGYRCWKS